MLNDFDDYASALRQSGGKNREARLLQYLRNFMINVQSLDEGYAGGKSGFLSNYEILSAHLEHKEDGIWKDDLSLIAASSLKACRHIAEHFRSRILRENIMMPSYRAKELGQAGIQWLARRSGRTLREKLVYTNNKLLAVQRRQSLDTGENRLLVAFVQQMTERLEKKSIALTQTEKSFQTWAQRFLRLDEIDEISRWENAAPNNTLLSDRYYRVIWNQWQVLGTLDRRIREDSKQIASHLATMLFWEILQKLSQKVRFVVEPVQYDYEKFSIKILRKDTDHDEFEVACEGLINQTQNDVIIVRLIDEDICIERPAYSMSLVIHCSEQQVFVEIDDKVIQQYEATADCCEQISLDCLKIIFQDDTVTLLPLQEDRELFIKQKVCLDVFSVHPRYLVKAKFGKLRRRILLQEFSEDIPLISAGNANALLTKPQTYSVSNAINVKKDDTTLLNELLGEVQQAIPAQFVLIPLPDAYNTFQLAPLRQMVRRYYPKHYFSPVSIAAVVQFSRARELVQEGDCFIVVSLSTQGRLALTLIQARYSDKMANVVPETQGLLWERHPTVYYKSTFVNKLKDKQIMSALGLNGLRDEDGKLVFYDAEKSGWQLVNKEFLTESGGMSENIAKIIESFQQERQAILRENNVRVILLSDFLKTGDKRFTFHMNEEDVLRGIAQLYEEEVAADTAAKRLNKDLPPIWSDHLPSLAIQRTVGDFPLIRDDLRIEPVLGLKQEIPVTSTFTLPAGKQEYHFVLLMGGMQTTDTETAYEACLRHSSFPLSEDIECQLQLSYTYGNDNPYELVFLPVNNYDRVPFKEVRAYWKIIEEYPYQDLPYPKFVNDTETWETLQHGRYFNKRKQQELPTDYLDWFTMEVQRSFNVYHIFSTDDIQKSSEKKLYNGQIQICWLITVNEKPKILQFRFSEEEWMQFTKFGTQEHYISCKWNVGDKRYQAQVLKNDWYLNNNNSYQNNVEIFGQAERVALYDDRYLFDFSKDDTWVSFSINHKGRLKGENIFIENGPNITPVYYVREWILGKHSYKNIPTRIFFPMHKIYSNGRTVMSSDCPIRFRQLIEFLRIQLPQIFSEAEANNDVNAMSTIFRMICIASVDLGPEIYNLILQIMHNHPDLLDRDNSDLGCALDDLQMPEQNILLQAVLSLGSFSANNRKRTIRILSKAMWKNQNFLPNLSEKTAMEYYQESIRLSKNILKQLRRIKNPVYQLTDFLHAFEYILGVFRLREWGSDKVKYQLSLNDPYTNEIPTIIEDFVDTGLSLPNSRVKLSVQKDERYKNVPDLLYAVMTYVRGGGDEIEITEISEEDI